MNNTKNLLTTEQVGKKQAGRSNKYNIYNIKGALAARVAAGEAAADNL